MSLTISRLTPGTLRIKATTTVATANHATRFAARSTRNCITSLPTARLDASRSNWECRSPGILSSDTAVSNRSFVDGNRTDRHHCVVSSVFSGALFASAELSAVQRPLRPMVDYMCAKLSGWLLKIGSLLWLKSPFSTRQFRGLSHYRRGARRPAHDSGKPAGASLPGRVRDSG